VDEYNEEELCNKVISSDEASGEADIANDNDTEQDDASELMDESLETNEANLVTKRKFINHKVNLVFSINQQGCPCHQWVFENNVENKLSN
jgi:hypothetical protein